MKKLLLCGVAGMLTLAACKNGSDGSYTISGTIKGLTDDTLLLAQQAEGGMPKIDTVQVKGGKFTFKGTTAQPTMAQMITKDQTGGFPLFLEAGSIKVSANKDSLPFGKADVTGTPNNDDLHAFMQMQDPFMHEMMAIQGEYMQASQSGDTSRLGASQQRMDSLEKSMTASVKQFVKAHPKSLVSGMALQGMMNTMDAGELSELFKTLDTSIQNSEYGKAVGERVAAAQKTAVGQQAPDFTMNDVNGKPVSLSSFKGKYVLIDFWASWCGPCRQENPNVVKVYNKYKDKNFTILGVSLDRENGRDDWLKAIKDDHLDWTQVSDLKYWQSDAAQLYGVQAIPANFLIDPQGKVVAKDLRGDALESKLAEVLQ
ncbi:TlpA disulfide reductase family protein [Compostibacter hankyongensis]|uniref:TlpA disulfide reductase family protein n=1 Tax=Compostibacter hankyongensis TaxID=1007089 RepID=A0ABP8FX34_9BACT